MRWRGANCLSSTCPARTAVSSSSSRAKRGTFFKISGLQSHRRPRWDGFVQGALRPHNRTVHAAIVSATAAHAFVRILSRRLVVDIHAQAGPVVRVQVPALDLRRAGEYLAQLIGEFVLF